jgi:two-component system sensor histidine kinase/response regulator
VTGDRHKNRLPTLIALALSVFLTMVLLPQLPAVRIVYVGVIWLSLRSSRKWHIYGAACLTTLLLLLHYQITQSTPTASLANLAVVIAVVWAVALIGAATETQNRDEVRTRAAAQAAGLWVWEIDMDGTTIWETNRPVDLGLEHVADRHVYKQFTRLMSHSDRQATKEALATAFAARASTIDRQDCVTAPDGSIRYYKGQALVSYDILGRPRRLIGITRENTEEVLKTQQIERQAAQLQEVQLRMQRAADSSQEGHWVHDLHTSHYWLSDSYKKLLGNPPELVDGQLASFRTLVHPDDIAGQLKLVNHSFETGLPYECELRMRHANGEWRWFRTRGNVERDSTQTPIHLAGSISDIHQQKLVEDKLRIARDRFERAIRGTQDGLWEGEFGGSEDIWCSPRCLELLGYEPQGAAELTGLALSELIHPDDIAQVREAHNNALESGGVFDVEHRMRTQQGIWIWVHSRATLQFDAMGNPFRISGSIQNVTAAHEAREELLEAMKAAQAANHAKSTFLANVSHEIRTPMNGIIGMTDLLLDTALDSTQVEYANIVRTSADSLLAVINDILDFSKIETGEIHLKNVAMDVRADINAVASLMSVQAGSKRLRLRVNIEPELEPRYLGDAQRIRQCLVNLISNAIKFTLEGEVSIHVSLQGHQGIKSLLRFEVRDTGIGIDASTLATLYQPFVQADSSTTRNFGGTGLGLSIVKRLADMMNAEVGASSEVGRGSTFWMNLPLEPVPITAASPASLAASLGTSLFDGDVLLVEDNEINQKVAKRFLEGFGCTVSIAEDGARAVQSVQQQRFDLVLMDMQMPVMDGLTATRLIRKQEGSLLHTPIVALTADALAEQRERCLAEGMDGYLTKPVDLEQLRQVIAKYCRARLAVESMADKPIVDELLATSQMLAPPVHVTRYVDLEQFIKVVGGDGDFARELATLYIESAQQTYAEILAASQQGDRAQVARAAHRLRGSSANIFAESMSELCERLEQQAADQSDTQLQSCIESLDMQLQCTAEELQHAVMLVQSAA